jgi:hypothetical protein
MRRFATLEAALDWARKEGFTVALVRCAVCGFEWWAVMEPGADVTRLECSTCGCFITEIRG